MLDEFYEGTPEEKKDPGVLGISYFEKYYDEHGLHDQAVLGAFPSDSTQSKSKAPLWIQQKGVKKDDTAAFAYTASGEWGKMTAAQQTQKLEEMKVSRKKVDDIHARAGSARKPIAYAMLVLGALLTLRRKNPTIKDLWPSLSTIVKGLLASIAYFLWKVRAPGLSNSSPKSAAINLPILGMTPELLMRIGKGMHREFLYQDRLLGFETWEMNGMAGSSAIILHNPIDRKYVLRDNWKNYLKNSDVPEVQDFSGTFAELFGLGIFGVDKEEWQDHRKIASKMFSVNGLRSQMEDVFQEHGQKLVKLLDSDIADTDKIVNLQDIFASFTFDTICQIAFGVDPDSLTVGVLGEKHPFLVAFDRAQTITAMRAVEPKFLTNVKRDLSIGPERELLKHLKFLDEYIGKIIRDRRSSSDFASRKDLLSLYISHARKTGKTYIEGHDYLRDVIVNFMVAGRDTTSSTLTSWFKLLGSSKRGNEVANALVEEGNRILPKDQEPDWDSVRDLVLGDAVFNEVMRMYPPVANDFRVADEDDVLPGSGFIVKRGVRTIIPNLSIGHDPHLWSDPDEFKPERWIPTVDPVTGKRKPIRRPDEYVLPCFWAGPRLCLGKDMARFEAKLVAFMLLSKFRFEILPHEENWTNGPVLFLTNGLPAKVKRV